MVSPPPYNCLSGTCSSSDGKKYPTLIEKKYRLWSATPVTYSQDAVEKCSTAKRRNTGWALQ
ncbi:hypothetical protein AVEN_42411-1, partial [Araneus ventricosus]